MQQSFNTSLPVGFSKLDSPEDILCFIEALFNPDSHAYPLLVSALQYENKPKFGPSTISNLRLSLISFDLQTLSGRLRIGYDMQLTFGCEDLVKDHVNQHSYYNFVIDIAHKNISFASDILETPSTADEF
ncbi:hypothetical protein [Mucilaginibacter sp. 44-25]|uniref:hypothetical protein n=1 Tax=Mucilaginibacter sp. 44-25 TaxID=1895794 RepID=UPI000968CCD0|nr:hypothetical protein [Mucilaginibacter sp. 44-25]OJW17430.1 MAG: hypothetical protein BGO48_07745 [Mucilaginibacter sp. 44-25]